MSSLCRSALLITICSVLLARWAHAQAGALSNTDLGKSQNTSRDLTNSLIPAKPKPGKGEKNSEVDPKTLQSKTAKDSAFEGGLNDLGLDWNNGKMGRPHVSQDASDAHSTAASKKEHSAAAEESATAKEKGDTEGQKEPKPSQTHSESGVDQSKAQKTSSDEKRSNKEAAAKADPDH